MGKIYAGVSGSSPLPNTFHEVVYLESTGTQWIDSGYSVTLGVTKVEFDVAFTDISGGFQYFGAASNVTSLDPSGNNRFGIGIDNYEHFAFSYGGSNGSTKTVDAFRHSFVLDSTDNTFSFDGTSTSLTTPSALTSNNLYFFARNTGSGADRLCKARLYDVKIYESGTLVHNFRPCYRIADDVPGLYDTVGGSFLTNDGTGDFITYGTPGIAREIKAIYAGVNGVAKSISKVYVGVNGVAELIWQSDNLSKVYLFYHGDACTDITGGWTKAFTFKTSNGTNYSMTRLVVGPDALAGNSTSTAGTAERCLYVRSVNSIDFTNYSKLCFKYEYKMPSLSSSTPQCRFGAFGSSYTDMRWSGYDSRFLAFEEFENVVQSDYVSNVIEVDVSGINESADVLYYCAFANMKASYYVRFPEIWLE